MTPQPTPPKVRARRARRADPKTVLLALAVLAFAGFSAALLDRLDGPADPADPVSSTNPDAPAGGGWIFPRADQGAGRGADQTETAVTGRLVIVDGDTIRIGDERIRIENIDTPEAGNGASCMAERLLADQATSHARRLLADPSAVRVRRTGQDQYGRTLARISVNGRDFGQTMIDSGLAQPWRGRRADWCGAN